MVVQTVRQRARALLRGFGIEVSRAGNPFRRLLTQFDVNVILDVGANAGQFAQWVRRIGYAGRIISFEPLADPYAALARQAAHDPKWSTFNFALGDLDGEAEIYRSAASQLSSLAPQTDLTRRIFGDATRIVAREKIAVHRLDSLFADICRDADVTLLKIDAQGFEKRVLDGGANCIGSIAGAHLELSYEPLYEGEANFDAMIAYMSGLGFRLVMLDPLGFDADRRQVLQADATFFRTS